ncbi:hypothetical protein Leryth_010736 [Lithospermum erythrorhizon]|nr:hypothetical protein Leryth_010736 [Lithospermum erythrorhizon]
MEADDIIGSYYLSLWRIRAKAAASSPFSSENLEFNEEVEEEMPSELDTVNSSGGFSIIGQDKLSVKYPNNHLHGHDVGVVQANKAAPSKRLLFYFEITVKDAGVKGQVAIGFTAPGFKLRRQPGWESNSYGYHGDDGLLYRGQGKEKHLL